MTKIVALCGASASGKSMICKALQERSPRNLYIVTTTTKVREKFDNPSYNYLCSINGNELMREYQTAIADNLWNELMEAYAIAEEKPGRYEYIFLDRSPLDAYIYEELFGAIARKKDNNRSGTPDVAFRAFERLFREYNDRRIADKYPEKLYIVGLTSLFPSNDPKRPPADVNQKYANEVRRIFGLGRVSNYPRLIMRALPNTRLDIEGRQNLLLNLLQDDYYESTSPKFK